MRKTRGFTMVEVIIVVAIIAILASIIMPKMSGSRTKTQLAACKGNLRHIAIAMQLYANDNNGYHTNITNGTFTNIPVDYLVPEYLKSVPHCPLGNIYYIGVNHPGLYSAPAGCTVLVCYTDGGGGVRHPGLKAWCPYYWVGGMLKDE